MKNHFLFRFALVLALLGASLAFAASPSAVTANPQITIAPPMKYLVHVASAANIDPVHTNVTYLLENADLTGTFGSGYVLWVTSNWNPGIHPGGVYNNHPIGVWYNAAINRWAIVNQDGAAIPVGASFNVLYDYGNLRGFCHITNSGNVSGSYTVMDFTVLNNYPGAKTLITYTNFAATAPGDLYNHNVGLAYDTPSGRWRIYNEDGAAMTTGHMFCGIEVSIYHNNWLHQTASGPGGNIFANYTLLDHTSTNAKRYSLVFATHYMGTTDFLYNTNHPMGVWYSSADARWSIFNQDMASMVAADWYFVFAIPQRPVFVPAVRR